MSPKLLFLFAALAALGQSADAGSIFGGRDACSGVVCSCTGYTPPGQCCPSNCHVRQGMQKTSPMFPVQGSNNLPAPNTPNCAAVSCQMCEGYTPPPPPGQCCPICSNNGQQIIQREQDKCAGVRCEQCSGYTPPGRCCPVCSSTGPSGSTQQNQPWMNKQQLPIAPSQNKFPQVQNQMFPQQVQNRPVFNQNQNLGSQSPYNSQFSQFPSQATIPQQGATFPTQGQISNFQGQVPHFQDQQQTGFEQGSQQGYVDSSMLQPRQTKPQFTNNESCADTECSECVGVSYKFPGQCCPTCGVSGPNSTD